MATSVSSLSKKAVCFFSISIQKETDFSRISLLSHSITSISMIWLANLSDWREHGWEQLVLKRKSLSRKIDQSKIYCYFSYMAVFTFFVKLATIWCILFIMCSFFRRPCHMDIILRQIINYSIWFYFQVQDLHERFTPRQLYSVSSIIVQVSWFYLLICSICQVYLL